MKHILFVAVVLGCLAMIGRVAWLEDRWIPESTFCETEDENGYDWYEQDECYPLQDSRR